MLQIIVTKRRLEFEISQLWAKIKNTFARISHTHSINQVTGLAAKLEEIRSLIQPAEKEVINATAVPSTSSVTSPVEGNYYFIKPVSGSAGSIYLYNGSSFQSQTPSEDIIYTVSDGDDVLIYVWNGSAFVNTTGNMVGKTIYISVSNNSQLWQIISSSLEQYTDEGQYNVYITYKLASKTKREFFTFVVAKTAANKRTQLLSNRYGFRIRSASKVSGSWSFGEWEIDTYSLEGHKHPQSEVNGLPEALEEIRSLIQPAPDKEVVSVLCAGGEQPRYASDGDRWLDLENGLVYEYSEDDGWGTIEPSSDCVYIASDTSHIYVWNGSEFVDSTGEPIDNTLYVSNLTTDLADFVDRGMYSLCYTVSISSRWYTFTVSKSRGKARIGQPIPIITTQMLMSNDGWQTRSKVNDGEWSEWTEHTFSYEGHKHLLTDITNVAVAPDSDAALWVPIEAATITAIVKGSYNPQDTAMFSGHPDYIPLTAEEVTALVGTAMEAFRDNYNQDNN